ncbi:MAG: tyrosine-type recombinase/integrase [Burkholderiaceae bacterium]|nr:tyrosine-type recombinase/integrase [Burkholderiaceae bacterium]
MDQLVDQLVDCDQFEQGIPMAKKRSGGSLNRLTVRQVQAAADGSYSDGGNLILRVQGTSSTWVFRYTASAGQRREMGLGSCYRNNPKQAGDSLSQARATATAARATLAQGTDPIDDRDARRTVAQEIAAAKRSSATREQLSLARAARAYHERVIEPVRTTKHSAQWISSLENHVPPLLWHKPIAAITAPELLDFVGELQGKVPETASRIRQRLESVFDDAEFRGTCSGNPARAIRRKLQEGKRGRGRERGHFASLPFLNVPAFVRSLRAEDAMAARCLEFTLLTVARTSEAVRAVWSEFDLDNGVWTIPAVRMKGGERHVVFLCPRAMEIVQAQAQLGSQYVFPSPISNDEPLSNMSMLMQLRRMNLQKETTVHGLRATFSTWAYENDIAREDVIEACLAHKEGDRVKAAYNRAVFSGERTTLLLAWGEFANAR